MVLKLVIIDDEVLIAQGLGRHLPWTEVNAEVVAVATNGEAGWEAIVQHEPDIVISDIVMPELSGLELAERLNRHYPDTRLILISAHREFEYAQRAIEQHVEEYILKPIEPEKLLAAVARVGEALRSERAQNERMSELERVVEQVEPIASASLLFQIARFGSAQLRDLDPSLREQLPEPLGVLVWLRLDPVPAKQERDLLVQSAKVFGDALTRAGLTVIPGEAYDKIPFLLLFDTAQASLGMEELHALVDQTCLSIGKQMKRICSAVISAPFTDDAELHRIYQETEPLAEASLLTETGGAVQADAQATYLGQDFESRMMVAIDQNYQRSDFSLKECSEMLHISSYHLSRLYKKKTGKSFLEHLTERRIGEASRLLETTDGSIAEVAERSGFADPKYFSQVFRKHRGQTPSDYRATADAQ